jgi:two-component system, cell cycle sensor histidine kinase and response regulator CckA
MMSPQTFEELLEHNRNLQRRLEEAEQTLNALRSGKVGALVAAAPDGDRHEARLRVEAELRESERRFRSIADTAPAGIYITGPDGLLLYVSQWCLTFAGLTMEQLAGGGWFQLIHPDDRQPTAAVTAAAVREQSPCHVEHRMRKSNGEYRWVTANANPRFVHGIFVGHIGIVIDITELKRSQERALANQKLESLGVLAAGIAHDFNNLLSTVLTHADLALEEIPAGSLAFESVSSIAAVANRAAGIVQLLMSYAGHADSGAPEPVELSSLVQNMVELLKVSISPKTSLYLNLSKDLPPIWANSGQIRQVVLNLVMNASEALEPRPGFVEVSTSRKRLRQASDEPGSPDLPEGDYVLLEISDSGCGMTDETKSRIFDPFFSTKFLGRGLGLASTQGIIRNAGGAISVLSTFGHGATFQVWLPCSREPNLP